ncbi:MAG: GtrA family protein [Hyphomicrobiaceae bacterium]
MFGLKSSSAQSVQAGPTSQFFNRRLRTVQLAEAYATAPHRLREFARYVGASAAAVVLDTMVFLGLVNLDVMPAPLAGGIGYAFGLVLSYVICVNYIFDVDATGKSRRRLLVEFGASGVLGIVLTYAMIALLVDICAVQPLVAKVVTVGFVFVAIYVLRSAKIFAPQHGH